MPRPKGVPAGGDTGRGLYGYVDRVRLTLPRHVDMRSGQTAHVRRVQLVNGDLLATVEFSDGHREDYYDTDLKKL